MWSNTNLFQWKKFRSRPKLKFVKNYIHRFLWGTTQSIQSKKNSGSVDLQIPITHNLLSTNKSEIDN